VRHPAGSLVRFFIFLFSFWGKAFFIKNYVKHASFFLVCDFHDCYPYSYPFFVLPEFVIRTSFFSNLFVLSKIQEKINFGQISYKVGISKDSVHGFLYKRNRSNLLVAITELIRARCRIRSIFSVRCHYLARILKIIVTFCNC
jgi:hypothetical protein